MNGPTSMQLLATYAAKATRAERKAARANTELIALRADLARVREWRAHERRRASNELMAAEARYRAAECQLERVSVALADAGVSEVLIEAIKIGRIAPKEKSSG